MSSYGTGAIWAHNENTRAQGRRIDQLHSKTRRTRTARRQQDREVEWPALSSNEPPFEIVPLGVLLAAFRQ